MVVFLVYSWAAHQRSVNSLLYPKCGESGHALNGSHGGGGAYWCWWMISFGRLYKTRSIVLRACWFCCHCLWSTEKFRRCCDSKTGDVVIDMSTVDQGQAQVQCEAQSELQAQEQQVHLYQEREGAEMVQNWRVGDVKIVQNFEGSMVMVMLQVVV